MLSTFLVTICAMLSQISLQEEDLVMTTFYIYIHDTYRFVNLLFGLTNALATQQRLFDSLFYGPEF